MSTMILDEHERRDRRRDAAAHPGLVANARTSKADRHALPVADDVIHELAAKNKICLRPVPLRGTDEQGRTRIVGTPCGCTRASVCAPCAGRAKSVRISQAREGWHLDAEPPADRVVTEVQAALMAARCDLLAVVRTAVEEQDAQADELRADLAELDKELRANGVRGRLEPVDPPAPRAKIQRSTRRRQGEEKPRRKVDQRTVGTVFGEKYRPSTFLTLTCRSYGAVRPDGTPVDPGSYDYRTAARDMITWSVGHDRFVTELRRAVGWNVQHFSTTEPQRRAAPHSHSLIRGSIPRAVVRELLAGLVYRQYWPAYDVQRHRPGELAWNDELGVFTDADGTILPGFREAAAQVSDDEPSHEFRFGSRFDLQGFLGGTPEADQRIRYVTKYVTKDVAEVLDTETSGSSDDRVQRHRDRLHAELRTMPCSEKCGLWVLYGVTPAGASGKTKPGKCRGRAHRPEFVGVVGRRCLVSGRWSSKDLADHRADRAAFVRDVLDKLGTGRSADRSGWRWTMPGKHDPDVPTRSQLLVNMVVERSKWRADYDAALLAAEQTADPPPDTA